MSIKSENVVLRPLEREDLKFIHTLDNNATVMRYWFTEPFVSYDELVEIYARHLHDQSERRFIVAADNVPVGLVEIVRISQIHRSAEFQIVISPSYQGHGYAKIATRAAIDYAFLMLNLYKFYLHVDKMNKGAIHIYEQLGFTFEACLRSEFFANGEYRDVNRMCILQPDYMKSRKR